MKKIILFCIFCIATNVTIANAKTTLSDDLPIEYIKEIKSRPIIRDEPDFPEYEKKTSTIVKVKSQEKLTFTTEVLPQQKPMSVNTIIKNAKINDKFIFIIAEDIYEKDKLIIKKGTKTTGILRKAHQGLYNQGPTPEIKISHFTTTNINNDNIKLKGEIVITPYPELTNVVISPKTIFKLYYK